MPSCHDDQVHLCSSSSSFSLSDKNHGRSKAQMCLKKILDFISFHSSNKTNEKRIESGVGNGIGLNLRLGGSSVDDLEYESKDGLSACSGVGEDCGRSVCLVVDKSSQRQCDEPKEPSNSMVTVDKQQQEAREESSEITHLQEVEINQAVQAPKETEDEEHSNEVRNGKIKVAETEEAEQSKYKKQGYLDLLVEAARLVSGDLDNDAQGLKEPSGTGRQETQAQCNINEAVPPEDLKVDTNWFDCYGGIEVDMSPLVRSKRGRNQVLPSRYRDSVIEPLRRVTTTPKSSKLSAAKRKSRK